MRNKLMQIYRNYKVRRATKTLTLKSNEIVRWYPFINPVKVQLIDILNITINRYYDQYMVGDLSGYMTLTQSNYSKTYIHMWCDYEFLNKKLFSDCQTLLNKYKNNGIRYYIRDIHFNNDGDAIIEFTSIKYKD